jgi:hypothetical protein
LNPTRDKSPSKNKNDAFNSEPIVLIAATPVGRNPNPKILDSGKNKVGAFYHIVG